MSVLSNIEAQLAIDETWVVNFFATLKADVAIVEQDFINIMQWLGAHGAEIASDVAGLLGIVAAAGIGIPLPILTAAQLLTTATNAVNNAIAVQQATAGAGGTISQQAIAEAAAAYQALKTVQISTSQAQAIVAKPVPPKP